MKKAIGYISYTHGLDGKVKIVPMVKKHQFEELIKNNDIFCREKKIEMSIFAFTGKVFICNIKGITKIEQAQKIIKNEIYTDINDDNLIDAMQILNFNVYIDTNIYYGKIVDYGDYGNGIVIEIKLDKTGKSEFYKCDKSNIIDIDFKKKSILLKKREEI